MKYLIYFLFLAFIFSANAFSQSNYNSNEQADTTYQTPDSGSDSSYDDFDFLDSLDDYTGSDSNSIDSGDFRNFYWGTSKSTIEALETAIPNLSLQQAVDAQGVDALCFDGTFSGYDVFFDYEFKNDTLVLGSYVFKITHDDNNSWFDDFNKIKQIYDRAYWTADDDSTIWIKDTYKDDPTQWGYALQNGDLKRVARWFTDRSEIDLELYPEQSTITLSLYYYDNRPLPDSTGSSTDDQGTEGK